MAFLKLLFSSSSLMLMASIISSSDAFLKDRRCSNNSSFQNLHSILQNYDIVFYEVELDVRYFNLDVLSGFTNITIKMFCDTRYVILRSVHLHIKNISISAINTSMEYNQKYEPTYIVPIIRENVTHKDAFILDLYNRRLCMNSSSCSPVERLLKPGNYSIYISYTAVITNNPNFFTTTYINEKGEETWLLATNFYPTKIGQVFPCWDMPESLTTVILKIVHSETYTIFSNMPKLSTIFDIDRSYVTKLKRIQNIPLHLVAIAVVSNFINFSNFGTNIAMYCRWELHYNNTFEFASNSINDIALLYAHKNWKFGKNFPKMDYIVIPNYWYNSMHYSGLVFIREADLIYDAELDPGAHQSNILHLISRALTYSFVDYFIEPYWSHMWFKESLAVLLGAYVVDQIYPTLRMTDLLIVQTQQESLRLDTKFDLIMNSSFISENNSFDVNFILSFLLNIKVPFILRMLQQIPKNVFFDDFILLTINKYGEKNSTLENYWYYMQHAFSKVTECQNITFLLKDVMDTWITQRKTMLYVRQDYINETVTIDAIFLQNERRFYEKWGYIPFDYVLETYLNFTPVCSKVIWLTAEEKTCVLRNISGSDWIIINSQQAGPYRVYYDHLNWWHIINYMNSENYDKIHVLNRAQLIDDSFNFMINRLLPPFLFMRLTEYLWRETDYIAWYPMFKALEYMSSILAYNSDQKLSNFKNIMAKTFRLLLDKEDLKYEELNKENKFVRSLRLEALKWACIFETPTCLSNATYYLSAYLANSTIKRRYSAEWLEWIYCKGLMNSDQETWNNVRSNYSGIHKEKVLEYLTCSKNSDIILNYYTMTKNEFNIVSYNIKLILSIIVKHAYDDIVLWRILSSFYDMPLSKINKIALLSVIINNVYTDQQYDQITNYVNNELRSKQIVVTKKLRRMEVELFVVYDFTKQEIEHILMKILVRKSQSNRIYEKYISYVNIYYDN